MTLDLKELRRVAERGMEMADGPAEPSPAPEDRMSETTFKTYAEGRPLPPRDQWVPRIFVREDCFYVIDLPADEDLLLHVELNPGTVRIEDALTNEILWSRQ